jgi:Na+/phosphate symporter
MMLDYNFELLLDELFQNAHLYGRTGMILDNPPADIEKFDDYYEKFQKFINILPSMILEQKLKVKSLEVLNKIIDNRREYIKNLENEVKRKNDEIRRNQNEINDIRKEIYRYHILEDLINK